MLSLNRIVISLELAKTTYTVCSLNCLFLQDHIGRTSMLCKTGMFYHCYSIVNWNDSSKFSGSVSWSISAIYCDSVKFLNLGSSNCLSFFFFFLNMFCLVYNICFYFLEMLKGRILRISGKLACHEVSVCESLGWTERAFKDVEFGIWLCMTIYGRVSRLNPVRAEAACASC